MWAIKSQPVQSTRLLARHLGRPSLTTDKGVGNIVGM